MNVTVFVKTFVCDEKYPLCFSNTNSWFSLVQQSPRLPPSRMRMIFVFAFPAFHRSPGATLPDGFEAIDSSEADIQKYCCFLWRANDHRYQRLNIFSLTKQFGTQQGS